MILCRSDLSVADTQKMMDRIEEVDGVKYAIGLDSVIGTEVPEEAIPVSIRDTLQSGEYKLILINSSYKVSTGECNTQIDSINAVLKEYDPEGMLIGEAPCTKDLIAVTNHDATVVSWVSIAAVFVIILLTMKSISRRILVAVIEFASSSIWASPTTPFSIHFIARSAFDDSTGPRGLRHPDDNPLQGGAVLRPWQRDAVTIALSTSIPSIVVSALGFFADLRVPCTPTSAHQFHVRAYGRGVIVRSSASSLSSPSLFMFDKVICKTSRASSLLKSKFGGNIV